MKKISSDKQKTMFKLIKQNKLSKYQKDIFLKQLKKQKYYIDNYLDYLKRVYGDRFKVSKHISYITEAVDSLLNNKLIDKNGEEVKMLLISCPPQHSKSLTITEALPSYYLGK